MADPNDMRGAPPREIHVGKKPANRLAWISLILGLVVALLALGLRNRHDDAIVAPLTASVDAPTPSVPINHITLPDGKIVDLQPETLNYDIRAFLVGNAEVPRTFTFDTLNFDTASAQIRVDDRQTLSALAQNLSAYPKATVRLVGYADARGSNAANARLGADRAAAVGAVLTARASPRIASPRPAAAPATLSRAIRQPAVSPRTAVPSWSSPPNNLSPDYPGEYP